MKTMLITGCSRGIGAACVEEFKSDYNLITVSRTFGTDIGDLTDENFVQSLINKHNIDVLINNAGILENDFKKTIKINYNAAADLCYGFYEKMDSGHIININSIGSNSLGWEDMPKMRIGYVNSKAAMKNLSAVLNNSHSKKVKVTSLEPAWVHTHLGGYKPTINQDEYMTQTRKTIPMKAEYIAKTIRWILQQPENVIISVLEIQNLVINDMKN